MPICKLDIRSTVRLMIGNIKGTFPPKSNFLQYPGYVGGAKGVCCILYTRKYPMLKLSKEIKKQAEKITFKTFISHVKGVEGSVHIN